QPDEAEDEARDWNGEALVDLHLLVVRGERTVRGWIDLLPAIGYLVPQFSDRHLAGVLDGQLAETRCGIDGEPSLRKLVHRVLAAVIDDVLGRVEQLHVDEAMLTV